MMAGKKGFASLSLNERLNLLKSKGRFVATRGYAGFQVHLYAVEHYYCEAWQRLGHTQVQWIELAPADLVADNYLLQVDIKQELGLQ